MKLFSDKGVEDCVIHHFCCSVMALDSANSAGFEITKACFHV
jgi:hypothetical protein